MVLVLILGVFSKSLLNLSENFNKAKKDFNQQGIEIDGIKLNIEKMMSNKNKSIQVLTKGVEFLFKKNKVNYFKGKGVLLSKMILLFMKAITKELTSNLKTLLLLQVQQYLHYLVLRSTKKMLFPQLAHYLLIKYQLS